MAIAPWLNINPSDFVQAAERGAALGLQRAGLRSRQEIAEANLASRAAIASAQLASREDALASRMGEMARQAEENRKLREWEMEQRAQLAREAEAGKTERGEGVLELGQQRLGLAQQLQDLREKTAADRESRTTTVAPGGTLLERDPVTGEWKPKFTAPGRQSALEALFNPPVAAGGTNTTTQRFTWDPTKEDVTPLP